MEATREISTRMGIREYFETLMNVMRSPARHFEGTANETGSRRALTFLMISALFYCTVSMAYFFENSLAMGAIILANAILMPAFGAVITFILTSMTGQEKVPFGRVFNIYAYASGAVMIISWIPGLALVMEPVRALLLGIGLHKGAGVGKLRAAMLIILTAAVMLLFFWTAAPMVVELKQLFQ
ncbi:YIP1 family protein [Pseudodesulfovibrio thermohalotolerans]|uniref:YIP1 family protein n=1 Tax=Pseudodesulfovibrio thermohalotolerans TaxID=2880651 RepID=UPI002441A239|nr:YIP1 family protein [Pseudodesulfovibrio thermohalotolerans]WFS61774.1 YIP1 family protein [Pseudodesulfovibrio thermohalotolerans]